MFVGVTTTIGSGACPLMRRECGFRADRPALRKVFGNCRGVGACTGPNGNYAFTSHNEYAELVGGCRDAW